MILSLGYLILQLVSAISAGIRGLERRAYNAAPFMLLFMKTREFRFRPKWIARIANAVMVGKFHNEENHPISRPLMLIYHPIVRVVLKLRWLVIVAALVVVLITIPVYQRLGSEFMRR
jgi:multidrug efflux pump subunit AcrB